jgi:SSS family solute:Na+ symporter
MHWIDWLILGGSMLFIVVYGVWKTRGQNNVQDFLKGNDSSWFTVGLSVMATQASAITFLSTPGQAFHDGMGFVQFYFGLPIAMVIICMVFIPLYHKLNVYTAYEFLESRFDLKTRTLTASLFLIQRGLSAGITIFAPSIILSAVLGWDLTTLNIIIGSLVIIYTVSGGTKAVNVTQKQQMAIIMGGMAVAFIILMYSLPEGINFTNALEIAGASGKLDILDFSFDFDNRYTFWSGIIGGTFLSLSYFGTDQSQVQRYLSGKSVKESQMGMIMNGLLKVPMQFFILLVGVMVFLFYQFHSSPLNFNPIAENTIINSEFQTDYSELEQMKADNFESKKDLVYQYVNSSNDQKEDIQKEILALNKEEKDIREKAQKIIKQADNSVETNDKDYVFIHFILNHLPKGVIGLLLAMALCAAMSSTSSELNALATTTTIDLYKRNQSEEKSDEHYVKASKGFTFLWGIIAILFACVANLFDNLIQLVNIIGSIFYGNVLGIFLLAFFFRFVKANSVFTAALITQIIVIFGWYFNWMPYLWLNLFGCGLVIIISLLLNGFFPQQVKIAKDELDQIGK